MAGGKFGALVTVQSIRLLTTVTITSIYVNRFRLSAALLLRRSQPVIAVLGADLFGRLYCTPRVQDTSVLYEDDTHTVLVG